MTQLEIYIELWNYLRSQGHQTIELIGNTQTWDFQVNKNEYRIKETFHHTIKSIFEDAGRWFLMDEIPFKATQNPIDDLNKAIDRMIEAVKSLKDSDLTAEMTFQWGEKTTIGGAIQQNLFHAVGHFSQIRNWIGIHCRSEGKSLKRIIM